MGVAKEGFVVRIPAIVLEPVNVILCLLLLVLSLKWRVC